MHPSFRTLDGMNTVVTRSPEEFSTAEVDDFVAFVLAGGKVSPNGLRTRVIDAKCIAFARNGECLVGVAGLKRPSSSYRKRVTVGSKFALSQNNFPLELGWVFILPSARNMRLSFPL